MQDEGRDLVGPNFSLLNLLDGFGGSDVSCVGIGDDGTAPVSVCVDSHGFFMVEHLGGTGGGGGADSDGRGGGSGGGDDSISMKVSSF
jgi:hypothetical protein